MLIPQSKLAKSAEAKTLDKRHGVWRTVERRWITATKHRILQHKMLNYRWQTARRICNI